jgi:hypothetical protein
MPHKSAVLVFDPMPGDDPRRETDHHMQNPYIGHGWPLPDKPQDQRKVNDCETPQVNNQGLWITENRYLIREPSLAFE